MNTRLALTAAGIALVAGTAACGSPAGAAGANRGSPAQASGVAAAASPAPATSSRKPAPPSTPRGVAAAVPLQQPAVRTPARFATPEAMVRSFAAAWNDHDALAVQHLTNGSSRRSLIEMRSEAVNLRLHHCAGGAAGTTVCYLDHDFPATKQHGVTRGGHAIIRVAPVARTGWYVSGLVSCD